MTSMNPIIAFALGLFIGAILGFACCAMLTVAKAADERIEREHRP